MPNTDSAPQSISKFQGLWTRHDSSAEWWAYYCDQPSPWHLTLRRHREFDDADAHLTFDAIPDAEFAVGNQFWAFFLRSPAIALLHSQRGNGHGR